jgi:hypothetical protein
MLESLQNNLKEYEDNTNYNSLAKEKTKEWYYTNIVNTGYKNYLENMNLCLELGESTSNITTETKDYYFQNYLDINYHPTYNCNNNNIVKSKYGLITINEALYSGLLNNNQINPNNWLITNNNYWTISPSHITTDNIANINYIDKSGTISNITPDKTLSIRPVISLKPKITISKGDGSINNPYIIK